MPKYIIKGGKNLSGEIKVNGAKNSALKIIPASILSEEKISITNLPPIEDVDKALNIIVALGATINQSEGAVSINTKNIKTTEINSEMAKKIRTSIMFAGPILARFGEVKFPHPGGCVIGAGGRPIDLFLDGFTSLGAKIKEEENYYHISAKKLKGCNFFFTKVSVTATENLIMTACLAKGKTVLKNCAMEPEIKALADYLNSQGAKINGAGTPTISIEGVEKISAGNFNIIPDRIESGSFAIMAAACSSELTITNCEPKHIEILLNIFKKIGVDFEQGNDWLKIKKSNNLKSFNIQTHEYPGFPTDLQAPFAVLMTRAQGLSMVHETIFDRRLFYIDLLSQMGADVIMCDPHRAVINGPSKLYGKKLTSPDLRAGMALVIAGLMAEGETEIDNIYQIERGYGNIVERLQKLGADIKKID